MLFINKLALKISSYLLCFVLNKKPHRIQEAPVYLFYRTTTEEEQPQTHSNWPLGDINSKMSKRRECYNSRLLTFKFLALDVLMAIRSQVRQTTLCQVPDTSPYLVKAKPNLKQGDGNNLLDVLLQEKPRTCLCVFHLPAHSPRGAPRLLVGSFTTPASHEWAHNHAAQEEEMCCHHPLLAQVAVILQLPAACLAFATPTDFRAKTYLTYWVQAAEDRWKYFS